MRSRCAATSGFMRTRKHLSPRELVHSTRHGARSDQADACRGVCHDATVRGATKPMPVVASAMTPRMDAASHVGHSTRRIGRTTDGPGSTRFLRRCRCAVSWHRRPPRWPARARSSTDRASDYGSEGWGFDSLRAHARLRQAGAPHPHPRCGALPLSNPCVLRFVQPSAGAVTMVTVRDLVCAPLRSGRGVERRPAPRHGDHICDRAALGPEALSSYTRGMSVRAEAHRLLDALSEDRLPEAVELLRQWAEMERDERPRREFRTTAVFDGEPDLGERAKYVVREAWADSERRSA